MTTYSGIHEDDDRLSSKWKHQKMQKYIPRKPVYVCEIEALTVIVYLHFLLNIYDASDSINIWLDYDVDSVISESGYSSSNSKDSFQVSTIPSTSHFLHSPSIQDTDSDDVAAERYTEYKATVEEEFQTGTSNNQQENESITTTEIKQLESNNCVKLSTDQQSNSIQSSTNHQLKLQSSAPIKFNRLSSGEDEQRKQKRFNRTAKALRDSGLLPIAIQTGHLLKKNLLLQKEINKLKKEAELFRQSLDSEENVSENTASDSSSSD
ncbi:hypothetical protein LOTGIDRAFT_156809 [Lottia gigantea]|uniref:Uncharacterized protein n=1 Tax=Lottia gigantea TaxID=225164 RepID=V4AYU7_LOTGI|nr:hypothetical protein LOTGIDRAFT_156809 [Lottia gigantea]ESP02858.1 hypothetical protein LOTGIDRAFT_156809 [Lottia gigantea]